MPDDREQQPPEILKQIQAAERKVERMVHSAEQEAAAILEKARVQAEAILAEKRRVLEEREKNQLAEGIKEAEREAERIVLEARVKANDLKARGIARLDEAVEMVLRRILPGW
jgi:vacuolar-type H+-ATPase subunit H